jgi:hypothetical protein
MTSEAFVYIALLKCPILSGTISGDQGLECPYLAEILDTSELIYDMQPGS